MTSYLAITPARDEELRLPRLIDSMTRQPRLPERWIIVNDGSSDSTATIIDRAARLHPWIEARHLAGDRPRTEGSEAIIKQVLPPQVVDQYGYVLRLDADLSFAANFVELLLEEFAADPKLGVAGAMLYEPDDEGDWREIRNPRFHTRGAAKMYSAACFKAIGGLDGGLGRGTVDEATALEFGFVTRSFRSIHAYHRAQAGAEGKWLGGFFKGYWPSLPRAVYPDLMSFVHRELRRRLLMRETAWQ